jgi:hypothetical protein
MTGIQPDEGSNTTEAPQSFDLKPPRSFVSSIIRQRSVVAIWWTLHASAAAAFLSVALGDFKGGQLGLGKFQTAEMGQVLQHLGVPINSWIALGSVFLGFFSVSLVVRYLWHRTLNALRITDLSSTTRDALQWAAKKQLLSSWLLVALACNAAMVLALAFSEYGDLGWASVVFLVMAYAIPILVLRPRWLGSSIEDHSLLPGIAALGAFVLLSMLDWAVSASFSALMGTFGDLLSFVPALLLVWLSASALLFVRSVGDIRSVLTSSMTPRFLSLVLLGIARPMGYFLVWLMPPLLLAMHYSIFIGPSVSQLAPYLPDSVGTAHRLFSSFANVFSDYWWIAAPPLLTVMWNLYMGRCLIILESRNRQRAPATPSSTPSHSCS